MAQNCNILNNLCVSRNLMIDAILLAQWASVRRKLTMAFSSYVWSVQAFVQRLKEEKAYFRNPRTTWTEDWLLNRERSIYNTLISEFRLNNSARFHQFFRLSPSQFDEILSMLRLHLEQQDVCRAPVTPEERLAITLRYLATGESRRSLGFSFRVSHSLVCKILIDVTKLLADVMMPKYVVTPSCPSDWDKISKAFYSKWNYPQCIGAIDGKRVVLQKPDNAGSSFFDYKGHNSIILLAIVDASYRFIYVNVGAPGRGNDAGVWDVCDFHQSLKAGTLGIPEPTFLPSYTEKIPYHLVGDDAFSLQNYLMKPYAGMDLPMDKKIFNYRLSRCRNTAEDTFGILASRFRVFGKAIHTAPEVAVDIVRACVCLHNFLGAALPNEERILSSSSSCLENLTPHRGREATCPKEVRDKIRIYFNTTGRVPWQQDYCMNHWESIHDKWI